MYTRIRDLREDRDLTQRDIAEFLGISRGGYSKYERGENDIPTIVLITLANFYKTTVDYLLNISDNTGSDSSNICNPSNLYPRIKELRKESTLNQTQFAEKIGMSQTGYSNYETGSRDIPTNVLIKLSKFYNVSTDYILGRTDDPKKY